MIKKGLSLFLSLCLLLSLLTACDVRVGTEDLQNGNVSIQFGSQGPSLDIDLNQVLSAPQADVSADLSDLPPYEGKPWIAVNQNVPLFTQEEITDQSFEYYGSLDRLDRCSAATASIGRDLMPTEKRESIREVRPTGWQSVQYDWVDGKSLYNRCHLIGFQLTGENANEKNLITGTRSLNIHGMLPFENMVADYVKETGNHVMYRVTPLFHGEELVARGVLMEGYSVEDRGDGVSFCVFAYNVEPGVTIDYATGNNWPAGETASQDDKKGTYILNTGSKKFHRPGCDGAEKISSKNKEVYEGSRQALIDKGYTPCGSCQP